MASRQFFAVIAHSIYALGLNNVLNFLSFIFHSFSYEIPLFFPNTCQVKSWMEEIYPGVSNNILSYIIGLDSLKTTSKNIIQLRDIEDIRLRMDGLFEQEDQAIQFTREITALYTNGPAGGGGIRSITFSDFLCFPCKTLGVEVRSFL